MCMSLYKIAQIKNFINIKKYIYIYITRYVRKRTNLIHNKYNNI